MRAVTRTALLIVLVAGAGVALAQRGPRSGPPAGDEPQIDDLRGRPPGPPRGEPGRFSIVSFSTTVILLDTANGDTWSFVSDDTPVKGHWEPIHRQMPERRDRRPPRDEREPQDGPPPDGPRGNSSGPGPDRDRGK